MIARRWIATLIAGLLVPVLVVTSSSPAQASSASGILANAWIITELGGEALSTQAELSPYEKGLATTATTGTVATTGLSKVPKAGALGMVLNTVAVLGGLAFAFGGGDDEPALPGVAAGDVYDASGCSGGVWYSPTTVTASCGATSVSMGLGVNAYWWRTDSAGTAYARSAASSVSAVKGSVDYPLNQSVGWEAWSSRSGTSAANYVPAGTRLAKWKWGPVSCTSVACNPLPITPNTTADPATTPRYIDSMISCRTPGGGLTPYTRHDGPFTITPGAPWTTPEVPDMTCPVGTILESGTRVLNTPGAGAGTDVELQEPYEAPPWVIDQALTFPECYPVTEVRCTLAVYRVAPAPVVDCGAYTIGAANPCADWWTDPQRSTRYDCRFGDTSVAMKRCKPYADTYSAGIVAPSDPDPDGEVTDPVAGADPTPEQTPELGDCVPNWGLELLNPWWVFKAQACALKWAFVPTPGTLEEATDGLGGIVTDSALGDWFTSIEAGIVGQLPEGSAGCLGPPVSWDKFDDLGVPNPWYPANACEEPVANAAHWSRLILTAVIGIFGLLKMATILARTIGISKLEPWERAMPPGNSHGT